MRNYCKICGAKLIIKNIDEGKWPYYSEDTGEKLTFKETQVVCPNYKSIPIIGFLFTEHTNNLPEIQLYKPDGKPYLDSFYHFKHF